MIVESWNHQWNCADSMVYMFFSVSTSLLIFFQSRSEIESNSKTQVSAIGTYWLDNKINWGHDFKKNKLIWYLERNAEASGIQNHLAWETTNNWCHFTTVFTRKHPMTRLVAMPLHLLRSQIFRAAWSVGKSWSSKRAMKKGPLIVWGI